MPAKKREVRQVTYVFKCLTDIRTQAKYREVTVPATWRVTYGPISPRGGGEHYLRFYEGTKQRACFVGVVEFWERDLTPIETENHIVKVVESYSYNGEGSSLLGGVDDLPF